MITASTAAPRGQRYALAIVEEAAFLQSASPSPIRTSSCCGRSGRRSRASRVRSWPSSVPYARRGVLFDAFERNQREPAPDVLLVRPTRERSTRCSTRGPSSARSRTIRVGAAAEYAAEFRSDVESFVSRDVIAACTIPHRHELPPVAGIRYRAFVDPSGGSHDSFTLAIAHRDRTTHQAVLDCVREVKPPFSPEAVVQEFAAILQQYGIAKVRGDRYGASGRASNSARPASSTSRDADKSEIYAMRCRT